MNYSELYTAIQEYLEVDETVFNSHIPTFVKAAEDDIHRQVQIKDLRKNSTAAFTVSNQYVTLPSDFLSPYSFQVTTSGSEAFLILKEVNFIRECYPASTTEGVPRFYGLFDDATFIVGPTPDLAYTMEMHYFYKPESIVTASTTWLGTNAESALLYGSIVHGYTFLKGDQDVITMYKGLFDQSVLELKLIQEGRAEKDTYRKPNTKAPT